MLELEIRENGDLDLITVASSDGKSFAAACRYDYSADRVAALSASFLAVGESLGREVGGESAGHVSVALNNGVMVSRRVADSTGVFTLSVLGRGSANLGLVFRSAGDLAERVADILDAAQRSGSPAVRVGQS